RRHLGAQHRGLQVPLGGVGQHPWDEAPTIERGPVGSHGRTDAGGAGDVPEGPGRQALTCRRLQRVGVCGEQWQLTLEARRVDLVLICGIRNWIHVGTKTPPGGASLILSCLPGASFRAGPPGPVPHPTAIDGWTTCGSSVAIPSGSSEGAATTNVMC